MFSYEHSIKKNVEQSKVWKLYSDVTKWPFWDSTMEKVELDGSFVSGTKGTMYIKNMPPLPFQLEDVEEIEKFTVTSEMGNIVVSMGHFLKPETDTLEITHTIMIKGGEEQQMQGIGAGMSHDIPNSMERLAELSHEV